MSGKKKGTPDVVVAEKSECVQVVVRCRPFNEGELKQKCQRVVDTSTKRREIKVTAEGGKLKTFTYDAVFGSDCKQADLYDDTGRAIVESVLEGYNGTIFAYGQTGTGKTFTMEGVQTDELKGVIPRAFEQIFDFIDSQSKDAQYLVRCSFIEIYQDNVLDLLLGKKKQERLMLKEHPDKGVYVDGLTSFDASTYVELNSHLQEGKKNRKTGETKMNRDSSRSHCVFSVTIECSKPGPDGENHIHVGKLNMVDLAGSERQSKTQADGIRLKEANKINLSLSALGNVISSLTNPKCSHVPYRDSKLTRLLQDSLGGNTKTVMIANVGPADYNYEETISTLRFASRAKQIQNKPHINEDPKDAQLRSYQDEINRLRAELAAAEGVPLPVGPDGKPALTTTMDSSGKIVVQKVVEKVVETGISSDEYKSVEAEKERLRVEYEQRMKDEAEEVKRIKEEMEKERHSAVSEIEAHDRMLEMKAEAAGELRAKLSQMEHKIVRGRKLQDKVRKKEEELKRKRDELKRQERDKERAEDELRKKEAAQEVLEGKVTDLDKAVASRTKKLQKLRFSYQEVKQDIEDVQGENQREREEMLDTIRSMTRQIQLKMLILNNFVPHELHDKVEERAVWDDEKEEWFLKPVDWTKKKLARPKSAKLHHTRPVTQFTRIKRALGDPNPRFREFNILDMRMDLPDRTTQDYQELQYRLQMQKAEQSRMAAGAGVVDDGGGPYYDERDSTYDDYDDYDDGQDFNPYERPPAPSGMY